MVLNKMYCKITKLSQRFVTLHNAYPDVKMISNLSAQLYTISLCNPSDVMHGWVSNTWLHILPPYSSFIDLRTAQVYCFAFFFTCWHPPISPFLFCLILLFIYAWSLSFFTWCIWYINWSCWQSYITLSVLMFCDTDKSSSFHCTVPECLELI